MREGQKHGKLLTVRNGYLQCPSTGCRNRRLIQVPHDAFASRLVVYCRECKREFIVDMDEGQCFESRGQ